MTFTFRYLQKKYALTVLFRILLPFNRAYEVKSEDGKSLIC